MVDEVLTLPQLGEGVFIWGWKSGLWKQLATLFGHKFGATGLQVGWPGGKSGGPPEGCGPGPKHASDWSGQPPDDPAWSPAWPDLGPNWTASGREFHRPSFEHKTPSPVN
jgi:hypothetical protein